MCRSVRPPLGNQGGWHGGVVGIITPPGRDGGSLPHPPRAVRIRKSFLPGWWKLNQSILPRIMEWNVKKMFVLVINIRHYHVPNGRRACGREVLADDLTVCLFRNEFPSPRHVTMQDGGSRGGRAVQ